MLYAIKEGNQYLVFGTYKKARRKLKELKKHLTNYHGYIIKLNEPYGVVY